MHDEAITAAFVAIGKTPPEDETICLYSSGILDSADLMQLVLEIELETGLRLDFAALMSDAVSLTRIRTALREAAA